MKVTQQLHDLGQSLWLDNITRDLLDNGTLKRYIDEFSVTGLTSNPTIFEHAISKSKSYDAEIRRMVSNGLSGEELFFELALQDLTRAADLFASVHDRTAGNDGYVSLEVSPLLAYDVDRSLTAAATLHKKGNRSNLFIKIPGTKEGNVAIEKATAAGVAINVTLLFSREHYLESASAYMRGLELRIDTGLSPDIRSVASVFVSRWDGATIDKVPEGLRDRLGIGIGKQIYKAYRDPAGLGPLAAFGELRRAAPKTPVCQYRHKRPESFGRSLYRWPSCAEHDQHHAGKNSSGPWRSWPPGWNASARWRGLRSCSRGL